jgi:Spy/CpxP family protein refolding chaperone
MKRLALLTALVAALAVVPAFAQQGSGQRGRGMGMGMGMGPGPMAGIGPMLRDLNLTDAQRQQVHQLMQENQPADGAKMEELQKKLHTALVNGDQGTINQVKADLNAAHAAQLDAHIALMQKIVAILTPEQKQQLLKMAPPRGRGQGR